MVPSEKQGLVSINFEPIPGSPEEYLFQPERFSEEFWILGLELRQLNDYCVLFLQGTWKRFREMKVDLEKYESGEKRLIADGTDFTGEEITFQTEEVPQWEDTYRFIARANCYVPLSAFLERSMKRLCHAMSPQASNSPKHRPGESKVDTYLRFLRSECCVDFTESRQAKAPRRRFRLIRNSFAHGDWDELRSRIEAVPMRRAFAAVADLLYELEAAAWQSPWGAGLSGDG